MPHLVAGEEPHAVHGPLEGRDGTAVGHLNGEELGRHALAAAWCRRRRRLWRLGGLSQDRWKPRIYRPVDRHSFKLIGQLAKWSAPRVV